MSDDQVTINAYYDDQTGAIYNVDIVVHKTGVDPELLVKAIGALFSAPLRDPVRVDPTHPHFCYECREIHSGGEQDAPEPEGEAAPPSPGALRNFIPAPRKAPDDPPW